MRVRAIDSRNIREATNRLRLLILLHWLRGPAKKHVPTNDTIFPNVNDNANFVGSPVNIPKIDPNDNT